MEMKCALCEHTEKSGNLLRHIKKEHSGYSIKKYLKNFGGESSIIHHSLLELGRDKKEVFGVQFNTRDITDEKLLSMIPKSSPGYQFQDFVPQLAFDISRSNPVALTGHSGCGKTSLIYELAAMTNNPVLRVNANQQTTISDFVGTYVVKGGDIEWNDGALPYAMKNGCWLIIDEIDYAEPAILSALNAVLEPSRTLMLKQKGNELVVAHPDFRIFATGNTLGQMSEFRHLYQGTSLMNEAFIDRWRLYKIDYLSEELEKKVLMKYVPGMTEPIAKRLVKVASSMRKAHLEETTQCTFSTRRLLDWSEMIIFFKDEGENAPFKAASTTILSKITREDALTFAGFIQHVAINR